MIRLTLPQRFWDDHYERCAAHPGERTEVKRGHRTVIVDLDDEALDDLRSDANFYGTSQWTADEVDLAIPRSARATIGALKRQEAA